MGKTVDIAIEMDSDSDDSVIGRPIVEDSSDVGEGRKVGAGVASGRITSGGKETCGRLNRPITPSQKPYRQTMMECQPESRTKDINRQVKAKGPVMGSALD